MGGVSTHWASARANATERIVLEFDHPQQISRLVYELTIVPNKSGSGVATLTALRLFA
jgi:hypothetical protein